MVSFSRAAVTAVLGPTNTGKTHLAVERMCAHSSGMMGFPLRLLAREVYDRVVAIKGREQVALITGEEKILPPQARWFLCTAESMPLRGGRDGRTGDGPMNGDFAFVALDEAQLGADLERGHIFTDRMLRARGREETMILGSATLAPMVRALIPDVDIISRPRFSTLSYAGAKKLSRLPKRSAIVAFSAEEVYAVAEMLRRLRGGAAVVMGALSPATRNAQVQMFLNGDVDYLVATDAIGMGLNLDVAHVAFASLRKFDGHRTRRLTVAEMAQIAGRAGRHHKDGTFGTLGAEDGEAAFRPEEILAIEEHRFPVLDHLYWRDGDPPLDSVDRLIAALEERPDRPELKPAPQAVDLAVLKTMAEDALVRERVRRPGDVRRLWDVCGLPDFQKLGADHHARSVARLWRFRSEGNGYVPRDWFAQGLARLDNVQGDVDTLSGRIAAARTWSYIAHRPDWLEFPAEMAERTRALEEKLSDALHAALTQRFVDRRTSILLRDIGQKGHELPVDVEPHGDVMVDGEIIGRLDGFRFFVDPRARGHDRKMLLAAAERRLGKMLTVRAEELIAAPDADFALDATPGANPRILWKDVEAAVLLAGPTLITPEIRVDKALVALGQDMQKRVTERLTRWMATQRERHLLPLAKMMEQAGLPETPAVVRAFFIQLADAGGIMARTDLDASLALLDKDQRQIVRRAGVTIGVLDIYHPGLLKPGAALWRMALLSARRGKPMLPLPPAGAVVLKLEGREDQMGARLAGFRGFADTQMRIDMVERVARGAHEAIAKNERYDIASPLIVSLGITEPVFLALMRSAGFRAVEPRGEAVVDVAPEAPVEDVTAAEPTEAAPEAVAEPVATDAIVPSEEASAQAAVDAPEPSPVEVPAEGALAEAATDAAPEAEAAPVVAAPTGANWVFRGRPKPRPAAYGARGHRSGEPHARNHGDDQRSATRKDSNRGTPPKDGARGGKGRPERKTDGDGRNRPSVPSRFADRAHSTAGPDRPAGGGAFAGLAALLGRDD
ncbi:helicase-related protein [Sphingobium subterraneum]|uniref:ATP-dependent RNA helicase SUPV3L1/SUV3 n=1 Tax=Sphingobium subterraneum TaxID=627688 RepID=A0A841J876_9SPHN|nr:helicase-related protein [Sphingobium subterraneum]MBB6124758.1 ATP-dependent RNA helicase SUPV3L1/SUV3 [Sphingobium subterraneum]